MSDESFLEELQKLVASCNASILYKPLKGEIDFTNVNFPLSIYENKVVLPDNKESNPFEWAEKCAEQFIHDKPYVLIPGSKFDLHGTRHGKGGGWYDRFLSKIPKDWPRIGIANTSQISKEKLIRKEWDQGVDWLVVWDGEVWRVYRALRL